VRTLLLLLALVWASPVIAEVASPGSNPSTTATTPAPVPAIPPGTPQTGAPTVPPERLAPPDRAGALRQDAGPSHASPLSGPPSSLTPKGDQGGSQQRPTATPPELSR
jgi:hypothetical protein